MKLINPTIYIVTLPVLSRTKTYKFHHRYSPSELIEIEEGLKVEKLLNFSFKGQVIQTKKKSYELHAKLKATIIQNCVITWKPVKTVIDEKVERHYIEEHEENNTENESLDINSKDTELIQRELNIGVVALESLSLGIPDYPRKKNVQFDGVTITSKGLKPFDKSLGNPFSVLKNFPIK